jgi:hypothetical protein
MKNTNETTIEIQQDSHEDICRYILSKMTIEEQNAYQRDRAIEKTLQQGMDEKYNFHTNA